MARRLLSAANSTLPLVSALPDSSTMRRAKKLLTDAVALKAAISESEEKLESIKEELIVLMQANDLKGVRWGLAGFEYRGYTTRSSLSKERLVELGVDPELIQEATVPSKEFIDCRFVIYDLD